MIDQIDHVLWHRLNSGIRHGLVRGMASPFFNHVVINEYPKSGASWMAQMVSEALDMPFPRNRLPHLGSCILHGHFLGSVKSDRHLLFWRDGRDVAVSWYYHFVVGHEKTSKAAIETTRREAGIVNPDDIETNFPKALEYFLTGPRHPRFTWASFVDRWIDEPSAFHIRYEDLKADAVASLIEACRALGDNSLTQERATALVDKYSFAKQAGRKPGVENKSKYLRKGVSGDWKNHFDQSCAEMFDKYAGKQLIRLGYEADQHWVADFGR